MSVAELTSFGTGIWFACVDASCFFSRVAWGCSNRSLAVALLRDLVISSVEQSN